MKASCSVVLNHAFVLNEKAIRSLCQQISEHIGPVEIVADCADTVRRTFADVEDLLRFENPIMKEIRGICVSAQSKDFSKHARVSLSNTGWCRILFEATACDDVLTKLRSGVSDVVAGMRPWYAFLHRIDFITIAVIAFCVLLFGALALIAFRFIEAGEAQDSLREEALGRLMIGVLIVAVLAAGAGLNRLRDRVFPPVVFLIGQGEARFRNLERIQWGVVIAFFVSLGASVIAALR